MDIKNKLLAYGKKSITLEALTDLLKADPADTKGLYDRISELAGASILEPVKNSGQNGNRKYPLFKKYRIMIKEESSEEVEKQIRQLHPALQRTGYLSLHVKEYLKHREVVDCLNTFLFSRKAGEQISRKERSSYYIMFFNCNKTFNFFCQSFNTFCIKGFYRYNINNACIDS